MRSNVLSVVQWINQLPEDFPIQALSQNIPSAEWKKTSISFFNVQKEQFVCQFVLFFPLLRYSCCCFCSDAALLCHSCFIQQLPLYCSVPMQHCCAIAALSSARIVNLYEGILAIHVVGSLWHIVIVNKPFRQCHCKWHCVKHNQHAKHGSLFVCHPENFYKIGALKLHFVPILIYQLIS